MYDKESEKKYVSDIEIIFQVLDKDSDYEISRKVKEISFIKESFYQIKSNNLHKGEIEFDLESNPYQINIKIIDIKSRRVWNKSMDIDKNSSDLFSDIYFYNLDNDDNSYINKFVDKDIQNLGCRFQYVNSKGVDSLNLYLLKMNDTLYTEKIYVKPSFNEYDINIPISDDVKGNVVCVITDNDVSKSKKLIFEDNNMSNLWSYDQNKLKMIMRYVLPNKIYKKIKKMEADELKFFLKDYFKKLDPDIETPENELIDELNFRIKYAKSNFKEQKTEGWKTDRGRIYIVYGQPKSINEEENPRTLEKRETWVYPSGDIFVFEKKSFGRYYLINGIF